MPTVVPEMPDYGDLPRNHADFHASQFEQHRLALLFELRCLSGLPELVHSLSPDRLYRLVVPQGQLLQQGSDGLFRGVLYGKTGIQEHAKFARIRPSLVSAAQAVGGQVLLISIAMQLNRIEKSLDDLSVELHRDRLAEVDSGIDQFEKAMLFRDRAHRDTAILNAVQTLHGGIQKTISELKSQIAKSPNPSDSYFDHLTPWTDKTKTAGKIMKRAEVAFRAALLGIRTLAECYLAIDEPRAAAQSLSDYFEKVHECVQSAAEKSRLVEFSGAAPPQEIWETFDRHYVSLKEKMDELSRADTDPSRLAIEVEFRPNELQGDHRANLPEMPATRTET